MTNHSGAPAQISEPIKIPDSGTRPEIIALRRELAEDSDKSRISIAEPYMKSKSQPTSQKTSQTMAAPISNAKKQSPANQLAQSAGLSVQRICRMAGVGESHFKSLARKGNAGPYRAETLARICRCPEDVFLWGLPAYQRHQAAKGAGGARNSPPDPITAKHAPREAALPLRRGQRPTLVKI